MRNVTGRAAFFVFPIGLRMVRKEHTELAAKLDGHTTIKVVNSR